MKLYSASDFEPLVDSSFAFENTSEGEPTESDLILKTVRIQELHKKDIRLSDTSGKYRIQPFSLYFEADHTTPLPQSNYKLRHPAFTESLTIFLSCKGPLEEGEGYIYEAIFG